MADTLYVGAYNGKIDDPGLHTAYACEHHHGPRQNAILEAFVANNAIPGNKYYWDAGRRDRDLGEC